MNGRQKNGRSGLVNYNMWVAFDMYTNCLLHKRWKKECEKGRKKNGRKK
jgi:hypothetical protein